MLGRELVAMEGSLIVPASRSEKVGQVEANLGRKRVGPLRNAQLRDRIQSPAERKKEVQCIVNPWHRTAGIKLDRATESRFRLLPFRALSVRHSHCLVRFGKQRVQLDRLLRRSAHSR